MIATSLVDTVAKQQIASVMVGLLQESLRFAVKFDYPRGKHKRLSTIFVGIAH